MPTSGSDGQVLRLSLRETILVLDVLKRHPGQTLQALHVSIEYFNQYTLLRLRRVCRNVVQSAFVGGGTSQKPST